MAAAYRSSPHRVRQVLRKNIRIRDPHGVFLAIVGVWVVLECDCFVWPAKLEDKTGTFDFETFPLHFLIPAGYPHGAASVADSVTSGGSLR